MADNKPCQLCSKRRAEKKIIVAVHVKDISSGNYGDDKASSNFTFECCDPCARGYMDSTAIQMRNYALDLTKDGKARCLLNEHNTSLAVLADDPSVVDGEVVEV